MKGRKLTEDQMQHRKRISDRLCQLLHGATSPLRAWGRSFLDPEWQDKDPELAMQSFSIYFVSLYDVFELSCQKKRLPALEKEARDAGFGDLGMAIEIFAMKSRFAGKLLSNVSFELQATVRYARDSFVHGPLSNYASSTVSLKWVESQELKKRNEPREIWLEIINGCLSKYGGIGPALSAATEHVVLHPDWIDEIEPLIVDPYELSRALQAGGVPIPWKVRPQS